MALFLGLGLLISAFFPPTAALWNEVDIAFFLWVNPLVAYEPFGMLVSILNSRIGDWVSHFAFASLLISTIRGKAALYSLITVILTIIIVQVGVSLVFKNAFDVRKNSPSYKVENFINIEKTYPLPNNHALSRRAFPGNHALTIFLIATWIALATRKAKFAFSLAFIFILPRLFAGAHGLSDIIAGAGGIVLILTPLLLTLQPKEKSFSPKEI